MSATVLHWSIWTHVYQKATTVGGPWLVRVNYVKGFDQPIIDWAIALLPALWSKKPYSRYLFPRDVNTWKWDQGAWCMPRRTNLASNPWGVLILPASWNWDKVLKVQCSPMGLQSKTVLQSHAPSSQEEFCLSRAMCRQSCSIDQQIHMIKTTTQTSQISNKYRVSILVA